MSDIDLGTLWRSLQAVDDGETPEDVYARVTGESMDPDAAAEIQEDFEAAATVEAHPHEPCREKHADMGICMGNECMFGSNGLRMHIQCPCKCHKDGYPWD